jgi:hypothetical protein
MAWDFYNIDFISCHYFDCHYTKSFNDATAISIATLSITTLRITINKTTFSMLSQKVHYPERHFAECNKKSLILNVIVINITILSVVAPFLFRGNLKKWPLKLLFSATNFWQKIDIDSFISLNRNFRSNLKIVICSKMAENHFYSSADDQCYKTFLTVSAVLKIDQNITVIIKTVMYEMKQNINNINNFLILL